MHMINVNSELDSLDKRLVLSSDSSSSQGGNTYAILSPMGTEPRWQSFQSIILGLTLSGLTTSLDETKTPTICLTILAAHVTLHEINNSYMIK